MGIQKYGVARPVIQEEDEKKESSKQDLTKKK